MRRSDGRIYAAKDLSKELRNWCYNLWVKNMQALYATNFDLSSVESTESLRITQIRMLGGWLSPRRQRSRIIRSPFSLRHPLRSDDAAPDSVYDVSIRHGGYGVVSASSGRVLVRRTLFENRLRFFRLTDLVSSNSYEVQVEEGSRSKGLGKRLVAILEKLGKEFGMEKVMLTVFLCSSFIPRSNRGRLTITVQSTKER